MMSRDFKEDKWRELSNHHKKKWLSEDLMGKRVYATNGYYLGIVKNLGFETVDGTLWLKSLVVVRKFRPIKKLWRKHNPNWKTSFKKRVLWKNIKRITTDKIIIRRWK